MELILLVVCHMLVASCFAVPITAGVVYNVKPTELCAHNSSCPSNETCHTMDYYASNSSHYFSPDHINVTLYFMCGVHNCTKHVDVHDLQTFAMIGTAGRQYVIINMPIPAEIPHDSKNRTYIFANVSNLCIENATIYFISLSFEGRNCQLEIECVNFYGYVGSMLSMVSTLNIIRSEAKLTECTFQHNCFVKIQLSSVLSINNCTFNSYNHALHSAIEAIDSSIKLSGTVSLINNSVDSHIYDIDSGRAHGGAITITSTKCHKPSSLFIITGANVSFINNTAASNGGALHLICTVIKIFSRVTLLLAGNRVMHSGGGGGAIYMHRSYLYVKSAVLQAINNRAPHGGAISQESGGIHAMEYSLVSYVNNNALSVGGAIFTAAGYIGVNNHSRLVFRNNSARRGGALYLRSSYYTLSSTRILRVGSYSQIQFYWNLAEQYGGAIYADDEICFFSFVGIIYSSKISFEHNRAMNGVGMHVYGASIKDETCMELHCSHTIVSYSPNITNSLSPVSSDPQRVCLCDKNGKPQCARLSSIFTNQHKVYRGEIFSISVVVVGYDFGVTTGTIYAGFIPSQQTIVSLVKIVNLKSSTSQCAFNHAGVLCGGCENNYSLAIGSSRCIRCLNNIHLFLIPFFLTIGIVLVIFIFALNLTVT